MGRGEGGGQPPKFTDEEIEAEGEKLLEWAKKPDSMALAHYIAEHPTLLPDDLGIWARRNSTFSGFLKKAKLAISRNRDKMSMNQELPLPMWQRAAHLYDSFLHEHDEAIKDRDSERRKAEKKEEFDGAIARYLKEQDNARSES